MSSPKSEEQTALAEAWTHWLTRDHLWVSLGLAALAVLAWIDLVRRADVFSVVAMGHRLAMPQAVPWRIGEVATTGAMWAVMMAAMMLPSATPMLLLFSSVNRKRGARETPVVPTGIFLLGYLLVWGGFSLLAAGVQWGLHTLIVLSPNLTIAHPVVGGLILLAAGIYQLTPLKDACLRQCQSPLGFLFGHWRDGANGAFQMGLQHGAYCLGCCWALMGLLFVGGVMNLTWIALIAGFVLLERVLTRGRLVSRLAGSLLVVWGLVLVWRG